MRVPEQKFYVPASFVVERFAGMARSYKQNWSEKNGRLSSRFCPAKKPDRD